MVMLGFIPDPKMKPVICYYSDSIAKSVIQVKSDQYRHIGNAKTS